MALLHDKVHESCCCKYKPKFYTTFAVNINPSFTLLLL